PPGRRTDASGAAALRKRTEDKETRTNYGNDSAWIDNCANIERVDGQSTGAPRGHAGRALVAVYSRRTPDGPVGDRALAFGGTYLLLYHTTPPPSKEKILRIQTNLLRRRPPGGSRPSGSAPASGGGDSCNRSVTSQGVEVKLKTASDVPPGSTSKV